MNFRISAARQLMKGMEIRSILDVGCRSCEMKAMMDNGVEYYGNDLFQNKDRSVTYVGDVLSLRFDRTFDCVLALDVVEHVDDPYSLMDKLISLADKYVIVSLPNIFDIKHKYKFVINDSLGGKYRFGTFKSLDRHRWVMNYDEIYAFYRHYATRHKLDLEVIDLRAGTDTDSIKWRLAHVLLRPILGVKNLTETILCAYRKRQHI